MHAVHSHLSHTAAKRGAYATSTALLVAGAIALILREGTGVWQLFACAAAPDLALLVGIAPGLEKGRLHPRAVPLYNAAHSLVGPALLAAATVVLGPAWLVGALGWALHITLDRSVGYGKRTPDGFQRS
jgi:hypothetical protein